MYTLGIDMGASSVKLAAISNDKLVFKLYRPHNGSPVEILKKMLDELDAGLSLVKCESFLITGSSGDVLREYEQSIDIFENIPAQVQGTEFIMPNAGSVISIGGQNACFITGIGRGNVPDFAVNESCASGTGAFFEDQMERLGLKIEDYSRLTQNAASIPRLSGRCAVFAKTDIIHRQQEGVPVEDILLGLCYAMVRSYKSSIVKDLEIIKPVALSGAVVYNEGLIRALKEIFELSDEELLFSENSVYIQAAGAAREAAKRNKGIKLYELRELLKREALTDPLPVLSKLPKVSYADFVNVKEIHHDSTGRINCFLGIDVGSTSTNLVLIDEDERLIDYQYLRTRGNPKAAVKEGMEKLNEKYKDSLNILRTGVTGSGRVMIGKWIGAQTVRDEITAQARSAVKTDPMADTVFEIGGQDSKYISIENGRIRDFQMNKICAAGTGSFVEEQAARLGIPLTEYGEMALASNKPVDLGERCTVFVESAIHTALSKGAKKEDIAAGLCLSIIRNYLHKVVGTRKTGEHIVLQGGVAYNAGIVAAFKYYYGDNITVSPYFPVSGAVGAALLALEDMKAENEGKTRHIPNENELDINYNFYKRSKELFLENYDGRLTEGKKTVGIPRCLMMHKLFPMANAFFTNLGYQVLLSDETDENMIRAAQQTAKGEECYPVKLIHGHFKQLADAGVDYIFMPSMRTIRHVCSKVEHNYACPYMQSAPRLVAEALKLDKKGITLLSPVLDMDFGQEMLASAMLKLGEELKKTPEETAVAMLAGGFAVNEFTRKTEELGDELINSLKPGEKALVLVTRNYGIEDPVLNMGIPNELLKRGYKILTLSQLHAHSLDVSEEYPLLYWPFGQHILSGAKIIRETKGLYAVYLTNHGCGPDTMISHLFKEAMDGKPYLQIEVDEHFSKVGVITRIEAFLNSLEADDDKKKYMDVPKVSMHQMLEKDKPAAICGYGIYSKIFAEALKADGYDVKILEADENALEMGRGETTSKEYFTFTMLLGMVLKGTSEYENLQIILPASEGAEADGQYWRVIRSILDEKGYSNIKLIPVVFEHILRSDYLTGYKIHDRDELFMRLILGDLYYMTPVCERHSLFKQVHLEKKLSWDEIKNLAGHIRKVTELQKNKYGQMTTLGITGEWPLVYEDAFSSCFWTRLEERNYRLYRMPFSEYLYFLWKDEITEEERFGDMLDKKSFDESDKEWLNKCREHMNELNVLLGDFSSFSDDSDGLFKIADEGLGRYAGAGGRYRFAKAVEFSENKKGTILAASMYENTEILLNLKTAAAKRGPMLSLEFDGVMNKGMQEKLESFLYYIH